MVEAERHGVVHRGLAGSHHNVLHRLDEFPVKCPGAHTFRLVEGLAYPLVGNLLGIEFRIPGKAAEGIPVGLGEDIAAEVEVLARVCHACNGLDVPGNGGTFSVPVGVAVEAFLPGGAVIYEMVGETEVLLGNLEFNHHCGIAELAKKRAERLARLEVHRSVLYLHDHIVSKLSVERLELLHGLVGPVGAGRTVYKGPPHNYAAVRLQGFRQHIGSVGVGAAVILRACLAFGIGLYQEAAEIRDCGIDFRSLVLPPLAHLRIERVAGLETAQGHRAGPLN